MTTRKPKSTDTKPDIQLLATTKCTSISGRGEVRYSIGVLGDVIHVKLVGSSGGGQINNAWIPFAEIQKLLENYSGGGSFSSNIFDPIFANVSSNNCGFTLAVCHSLKLVLPLAGNRKKFVFNSPAAFLAKVDKLMAAKAIKKSPRRKTKVTAQC